MNKVIVVEGRHDESKILSVFPDAYCIVTNGSEINQEIIDEIKKALISNKVYLCLDPDGPGNKIRNKILNELKDNPYLFNIVNVYATQEKAISSNKKKIGIEHMKESDIKKMFDVGYHVSIDNFKKIEYIDIYKLGLADNMMKRKKLCDKMNIGYCNTKQLIKKLNMFGITLDEVKKNL